MEQIDKDLLNVIADSNNFEGAYNIRKNGEGIERKITENVNIITKKDKEGSKLKHTYQKHLFEIIKRFLEMVIHIR